MQKRAVSKSIKAYSLTQIFLLVCMTFAIAFLLGQEISIVSATSSVKVIHGGTVDVVSSSNSGSYVLGTDNIVYGATAAGNAYIQFSNFNGKLPGTIDSTLITKTAATIQSTVITPTAAPLPAGVSSNLNNVITVSNSLATKDTLRATSSFDLNGQHFDTGTKFTKVGDSYTTIVNGNSVSIKNPDNSFFSNTQQVTYKQNIIDQNPTGISGTNNLGQSTLTVKDAAGKQTTYTFDSAGSLIGSPATVSPYQSDKILGFYQTQNFFLGNMLEGLQTAVGVAGFIALGAQLFGASAQTTKALSGAVGAGIFGAKLARGLVGSGAQAGNNGAGLFGSHISDATANWIGLAIGIAVFIATYKQQEQKLVSFACMPWEPALGGASCEKCNSDPFRPCSEYRCRSLGQACQLLNAGTGKESCAWVSPKDVTSPTITEWDAALKPTSLVYNPDPAVRPGARGVKIVAGTADGCLPAFTPLQFGVLTNEPAQCKIDFNRTGSFGNMSYYFGGSNYYEYNHTQIMRLPSPNSADSDLTPLLQNDGSFNMYTRCRDANGNENVDEYSINFCVSAGPDTTPPIIEDTSITDGSAVQSGADKVPIEVYVNEPAVCKWSKQDREFDSMENTMSCATQASQVNANLQYTCAGNLTGVADTQNNSFFFRCKDQPTSPEAVRNVMRQSYTLSLVGTDPLVILNVGPNSTITSSTTSVPVDLTVETGFGASDGKAVCRFSTNGRDGSFVDMYNTNEAFHKQPLSLSAGNYTYFVRCVDSGGNLADANTTFSVSVDSVAPLVTRVYKEEPETLKIITNENAECAYSLNSCVFNFKDGIKFSYQDSESQQIHVTTWKTNTPFYIKCRDSYGNEPNPSTCSIVATGLNLGVKAKTSS